MLVIYLSTDLYSIRKLSEIYASQYIAFGEEVYIL